MTIIQFMKKNPISTIIAFIILFTALFFPIILILLFFVGWLQELFTKKKEQSNQPYYPTKQRRSTPSIYSSPNLDRWTTTRYHAYLQSSEWKSLVSKVKSRDRVCQLTGSSDNLEVHHITYDRLGNEDLSDLVLLSRSAHQFVHDYYGSYSRNNTYPINNLKGLI
jgi:5-methylcytosine-specific restriction endonuclease McrA